jgi:glycosyltransferase involved in cell wall biosynthesis
MKVVIVNCFDTYEQRIDMLYEYFISKGNEVTVIESDFRHFQKTKRTDSKTDFIFVESQPYYKNMSVDRLTSHYKFSKNAFKIVEDLQPDFLYVTLPPNSLAKFAAKYKKSHPNVQLYFDLIDLWPETMPVGKIKNLPPFTFWRQLRDKYLKYADFVITECNLYQSVLKNQLKGINTETVYLAKPEERLDSEPSMEMDKIHLCYLGSINNIIDISLITKLVNELNKDKPVVFHIIGDGENRNLLIEEVKRTGTTVEYYGKVYDTYEKKRIFDQCHFGLNVMKETVCVGLTMKSIDYFQAGLPILNTIQADTAQIVEDYKIGINVSNENLNDVASRVKNTDLDELLTMRKNTHKVFDSLFSLNAFKKKMDEVMGMGHKEDMYVR